MCDPASSRKKGSDNTAIPVVGIDAANNKYLLDGYHHKMSLSERWTAIRNSRRHWLSVPGVQMVRVGYERFGMHDALEYFQERMRLENDSFEIVELAWPNEGPGSKYDRIQRLEPDFRNGRWYFAAVLEKESPNQAQMRAQGEDFRIWMLTKRMDENKRVYSLSGDYSRNSRSTRFPSTTTSWMRSRASTTPPIQYDERWLEPDNG